LIASERKKLMTTAILDLHNDKTSTIVAKKVDFTVWGY
jgi:hypothetical protein